MRSKRRCVLVKKQPYSGDEWCSGPDTEDDEDKSLVGAHRECWLLGAELWHGARSLWCGPSQGPLHSGIPLSVVPDGRLPALRVSHACHGHVIVTASQS